MFGGIRIVLPKSASHSSISNSNMLRSVRCSEGNAVRPQASDNVDYTRFHQQPSYIALLFYEMPRTQSATTTAQTSYCLQWKHNEVYHKEQMNSKLTEATLNTTVSI